MRIRLAVPDPELALLMLYKQADTSVDSGARAEAG